jgi:hypothetical protein
MTIAASRHGDLGLATIDDQAQHMFADARAGDSGSIDTILAIADPHVVA